jgi:hypothetical protein
MSSFGLGHIPNASHRFSPVGIALARVGIATAPERGIDYRSILPTVFDQGQTSSCEGHAASAGIYAALQKIGAPLGFIPSMADLYRGARRLDRGHSSALADHGTEGNSVIRWMQEFGVRPMEVNETSDGRFSDCEVSTINSDPKLGDLERDGASILIGAYSILDTSRADVIAAYAQSLLAFGPIPTASYVDSALFSWNPAAGPIDSVNYDDPKGGEHKILCVGWRWTVNGAPASTFDPGARREWILRNSWGDQWGESGHFYATDRWLAQTDEREVYAVRKASA